MSIEYRLVCEKAIPDPVRQRIMDRADIIAIEEVKPGETAVRFRIDEEHEKATGSSFSFYIEDKEIVVSVHSAVGYAHTEAAYLVLQAFMDSGISFCVEEL